MCRPVDRCAVTWVVICLLLLPSLVIASAGDDDRTRTVLPMTTGDIVGSILCIPIAMLAAGAGLGGGPLFIPLLIIVVNFSVGFAIPLSKAMIFGVSVAQFLINVSKRSVTRPHNQSLIDYDIALLVEPMTLLGTTWGVFLNIIFPDWMTLIAISLLLLVITSRTSLNALKIYHRESAEQAEAVPIFSTDGIGDESNMEEVSSPRFSQLRRKSLTINWGDGEVEKVGSEPPWLSMPTIIAKAWGPILVLVLTWTYVFLVSLLKGGGEGEASPIGVEECSFWYWALVLSEIPVIGTITVLWGLRLRHVREKRLAAGASAEVKAGEVEWNLRNRIIFPCLSFFAGVVAGMMGIGGGMIKSPLLLELGKNRNAQSTSATCAFMILFTSSSTTLQYLILGRLNVHYAVWYGVMGFIGSLIGKLVINALVKRYRKSAFIILCVAVFLGLGTLCLMTEGVGDMILAFRDKTLWEFHSICDA